MLLKKIISSFLFFLLIQPVSSIAKPVFSVAIDSLLLDPETFQELSCVEIPRSLKARDICINEKVTFERLENCSEYTIDPVAEALCLKNKELSTEYIQGCHLKFKDLIEEQACLLGPDLNFFEPMRNAISSNNFEEFSELLEPMKTEIENALGFGAVEFNIYGDFFIFTPYM